MLCDGKYCGIIIWIFWLLFDLAKSFLYSSILVICPNYIYIYIRILIQISSLPLTVYLRAQRCVVSFLRSYYIDSFYPSWFISQIVAAIEVCFVLHIKNYNADFFERKHVQSISNMHAYAPIKTDFSSACISMIDLIMQQTSCYCY